MNIAKMSYQVAFFQKRFCTFQAFVWLLAKMDDFYMSIKQMTFIAFEFTQLTLRWVDIEDWSCSGNFPLALERI